MRAAAKAAGLAVEIDSAGTGDWHIGKPPDRRAQAEMQRRGIDISHLRGRQVDVPDFQRFTHIFALDGQNLRDLAALAPTGADARLNLLLDWVPGRAGQSVADPYFGGDEGFARTWEDVSAAAEAITARLLRGL